MVFSGEKDKVFEDMSPSIIIKEFPDSLFLTGGFLGCKREGGKGRDKCKPHNF